MIPLVRIGFEHIRQYPPDAFAFARAMAAQEQDQPQIAAGEFGQVQFQLRIV